MMRMKYLETGKEHNIIIIIAGTDIVWIDDSIDIHL